MEKNPPARHVVESQDWIEIVREQIGSLRFGVVEIVVHDARVVQIEKTEKVRLSADGHQSISAV